MRFSSISITASLVLTLIMSGCGSSDSATSSTNDTQPPPEGDQNQAPVALISGSHAMITGATVTLEGDNSYDPDGDSLTFQWSQTAGPTLNLGDSANTSLSFVAPDVSQPTQYSFRLTVDDGELSHSADFNLQVSPLSDSEAPRVSTRSPDADETGVAITSQIQVTFNEALLPSSIDASSLTLSLNGSQIPGSVSYSENSQSLTFTPTDSLTEETLYLVTLSDSATDMAGNAVTAESWSFTTASGYNLGATPQETIDLCMDTGDKEMLSLVNDTRAAARDCGSTNYAAVQPLAWHCLLESAAQTHSSAMATNDFFDHTGLDNSSPGDRITAAGYAWRTYGENIAAGYGDAQAAMAGWISSPGHCANLMNPNFTQMGAASATNAGSTYGIYWTQNFAAPLNN
jgi:uncharacterized protein YkwD